MKTIKKIVFLILVVLLAFSLVACLSNNEKANPSNNNNVENTNTEAKKPQESTVNIPVLTDVEAEQLEIETANRFMKITSGGFGPGRGVTKANDELFFYFPEELNSVEKLQVYLEEVLTTEMAKEVIDPEYYKIINGKLAFKLRDYESFREWDRATYKVTYEKEDKKTYEYTVPSPGGKIETITIEFKYERDGWRVATHPEKLL